MQTSLDSRFHACATCQHFKAEKQAGGMKYLCRRLGYDTKTHYRFDCWVPRKQVKKQMEKEQKNDRHNKMAR